MVICALVSAGFLLSMLAGLYLWWLAVKPSEAGRAVSTRLLSQ
jgi:hypothetical protein